MEFATQAEPFQYCPEEHVVVEFVDTEQALLNQLHPGIAVQADCVWAESEPHPPEVVDELTQAEPFQYCPDAQVLGV